MNFFKILPNQSIKASLIKLKKNGAKGLVVVNKNNKLLGTLTDGDLRNALLKSFDLNSKISNIYNKKPDFLIDGKYSNYDVDKLIYSKGLTFIPIVNNGLNVINILTIKKIKNKKKSNKPSISSQIACVIMAGGKGTRLKPFTDILPKPLLPIQKQTVIEKIINSFNNYGLRKFIISVNYKSEILKAFFKELKPKYSVNFIQEKKPLGTAGSLSKLKNILSKDIFVSNCDVIIDVDLKQMLKFHKTNNFDITILTSRMSHRIPYGVCEITKNNNLKEINEKPKFDFLANVGVYLVKKKILSIIPKNKKFDFTQLIRSAKKQNKKIGVFSSHQNSWLDVGQWNEFNKTIEKFK